MTFYDAVGGDEAFERLVRRFYEGVAEDPVLRPLYPEEDLAGAEERLRLFLIQYWGGPTTYSENRGHPRLRMRHAPFTVDRAAHDAWLKHMRDALVQGRVVFHCSLQRILDLLYNHEPLADYLQGRRREAQLERRP